ncbi:MBL fold metallo-hydrolase [Cerasicoccus maritimus]|uniref:MBL fold metallo-hydrolase n=1 Tax=Cerasicoccus maritimus TaxID=490089 RepID=UPI002852732C|nr:MBL fold metallo-hydrolase [Cerasicoccus maritimus]
MSNPKNWRTRSSIHVVMDGHHVQVDASPEFRLQCIRNQIEWIDDFILTHPHADHIQGMDDLRRFCDQLGGTAMPVYSTEIGLARIRQIYPYAIGETPASKGYAAFRLADMPAVLETPGGTVSHALLPHGGMQTLGLVFEEKSSGKKFAYYNDCHSVPPAARELAAGADVVVLDGLRPKEHPTHMSTPQAMQVAVEMGAPASYLTHFTFHIDHETWAAKMPENVYLAYDGLRLSL